MCQGVFCFLRFCHSAWARRASRNLLERPPGAPKNIGRVRGRPETISQECVTTLKTDTPSLKSLTLELEKRRTRRQARRRGHKQNGAAKQQDKHVKPLVKARKMIPGGPQKSRKCRPGALWDASGRHVGPRWAPGRLQMAPGGGPGGQNKLLVGRRAPSEAKS